MLPWLYSRLIRLHPAGFRARFGDEMLDMFADSAGKERIPLIGDGLLSLIRQWAFRPEFRRPPVAVGSAPALRSADAYNPSPMALFHGVLLSVLSFTAVVGILGEGRTFRIPARLDLLQVTPPPTFDAVSIRRSPAAKYQRVEMAFLPRRALPRDFRAAVPGAGDRLRRSMAVAGTGYAEDQGVAKLDDGRGV